MVDALSELAKSVGSNRTFDEIFGSVLPCLRELATADSVYVVRQTSDGPVVSARVGEHVEPGKVISHVLPGAGGVLTIAWADPQHQTVDLSGALAIVDNAMARVVAGEALSDLEDRMNNAQQLANMGDYDWHIASNSNRWSDQLFRIYGHEPQAFNATYERFLSFIHPDDRASVQAIHHRAYATGEPYEMVERIVRPDGKVRYLASNGQVLTDANGTPERMRGTCIDITDRVQAEERFRSLVESCPDAILVLDVTGTILEVNGHASTILGDGLVGRTTAELRIEAGEGVLGRSVDGRVLELDVTTARLTDVGDGGRTAVFLRAAAPRIERERLAAQLREVQVRRRQALEVNDNIVQGLVAAVMAMGHDARIAGTYLESTLAAARRLMNDWLEPLGGEDLTPGGLMPGDLIRTTPSSLRALPPHPPAARSPRILIVDDNGVVRKLMRLEIESLNKYDVVGEAADGEEAVEQAIALQPDLVLLDLAMPVMDGLQALPLIRAAVSDVRVIVLSGFDVRSMAPKALAAGADRYLEKGFNMDLGEVIDQVIGAVRPANAASNSVPDGEALAAVLRISDLVDEREGVIGTRDL